eukprot:7664474-Alexandrium_andersonii.AAC.1
MIWRALSSAGRSPSPLPLSSPLSVSVRMCVSSTSGRVTRSSTMTSVSWAGSGLRPSPDSMSGGPTAPLRATLSP